MDSWKAEVSRVRREKIRRKKMQVREKVGTSWNTESRQTLCFSNDLWWREAHFQVKMYKTLHVRATFGGSDVEKVHAVVPRSTFPSQNAQNTTCSRHFGGSDVAWLHYTTLHYTTLHYTTRHYTTLPSTTLHYITLHSTTLQLQLQLQLRLHNYTPLHSTARNYTTLHYITLHYTTLHYTTLHSTTLHYITLHYMSLNDTAPQIDR